MRWVACVGAWVRGPGRRLAVEQGSASLLLKAVMAAARWVLWKVAWPPGLLLWWCLAACGSECVFKVYIENRIESGITWSH